MPRLRPLYAVCLAVLFALAALAPAAGADHHHKPAAPRFKCPKGLAKVKVTVSRHGKKKVVYHCRKTVHPKPPPVVEPPKPPGPTGSGTSSPPGKQASTTTLAAAYQDLPPEREGFVFRIGQLALTGSVSPSAVPDLRCNGLAGCLEPAGSLSGGSLTVPVIARPNYEKKVAHWELAVTPAQGPPTWLTLAEAASGNRFFQATGAPDPSAYLSSTARAPFQIVPHLPGAIRHEGELNDPTIDETFQSFAIVGSYKKLGGTGFDLVVEGNESVSATNSSGCQFQVRINGIPPTSGDEKWTDGVSTSIFANRIASTWQVEIWVRHEGGTANCGLSNEDTYLVSERPHS